MMVDGFFLTRFKRHLEDPEAIVFEQDLVVLGAAMTASRAGSQVEVSKASKSAMAFSLQIAFTNTVLGMTQIDVEKEGQGSLI